MVIAVQPRLLADALLRALTHAGPEGLEVVIWLDRPGPDGPFDLAVVGSSAEDIPPAETVVRITDRALHRQGSATAVTGTQPAAVDDLPGLLDTIRRCLVA